MGFTVEELYLKVVAEDVPVKKLGRSIRNLGMTTKAFKIGLAAFVAPLDRAKQALISQGMGADTANRAMKRFLKNLPNLGMKINHFGSIVNTTTEKLVPLKNLTNNMSKYTLKRFAGEWLSLMFIGQGISMTFQRMIDPVMKLSGVFEVWRATLISVMGPALFPFAKHLRGTMGYMRELDDDVKFQIGTFGLLAYAITSLISPMAQLSIIIHTLGGWKTVMGKIGTFFSKTWVKTLGKIFAWGYLIYEMFAGIYLMFTRWGKNVAVVGRGFLQFFIAAGAIGLALFGVLTVGWAAFIAGATILVLKLLAPFKWMQKILTGIGRTIQAIIESVKGLFGKGAGSMKAGWEKGWNAGITPMASGGIVTKPTLAMIGEAGPEAVVPLSGGGGGGSGMNYNPTINVYGGGSSAMDIDRIVREVNSRLYDDTRRL